MIKRIFCIIFIWSNSPVFAIDAMPDSICVLHGKLMKHAAQGIHYLGATQITKTVLGK
jgi:hypothetical protein